MILTTYDMQAEHDIVQAIKRVSTRFDNVADLVCSILLSILVVKNVTNND